MTATFKIANDEIVEQIVSSGPVILLVDDEPAGRQTLEALLEGQGYCLLSAANGPEALALAAMRPPDLILLDVMMPGMDGFEVCRRLRADPLLAEAPIVLVTALDDQESRLEGLEAGADDFISKPYNRAELRARVRTITRLNRYRRLLSERLKFQWMAEQSTDGFVTVDERGVILYTNPWARLFLAQVDVNEDPAGQDFLALATKRYLCEPPEAWAAWPELTACHRSATRYLVRPESPTSPALWLAVRTFEQADARDKIRLLNLRDVTQQVTSWRDMRTFHTVIAHKLLTPLNVLIGSLEAIAGDETATMADVMEMVELARSGGCQLQESVEDILHYLKGDSLIQVGGHEPLSDLPRLADHVAAQLALSPPLVDVAPSLAPRCTGLSPRSIEWILWELMENSKKFHPRRAPALEIRAALRRPGWATVLLADDGVSLSPEQINRVWLPYYQGEKCFTGETPGMGLGLATVAAAIWHVGGEVRLSNRMPGPGVAVEMTIPLLD